MARGSTICPPAANHQATLHSDLRGNAGLERINRGATPVGQSCPQPPINYCAPGRGVDRLPRLRYCPTSHPEREDTNPCNRSVRRLSSEDRKSQWAELQARRRWSLVILLVDCPIVYHGGRVELVEPDRPSPRYWVEIAGPNVGLGFLWINCPSKVCVSGGSASRPRAAKRPAIHLESVNTWLKL